MLTSDSKAFCSPNAYLIPSRTSRKQKVSTQRKAFILEKAVDHGEHGERAGKTIACLKEWLHPEGDRTLQANPLFFPVPLQGGFALFPVPPVVKPRLSIRRFMLPDV
jgi:hypothetical protein